MTVNKIYFTILVIFSICINQYFGYRGVYPIDSFVHFDASYNITAGKHPFKDWWLITAPFLLYLQSLFFFIFKANWFSYVLHASMINMVFTLFSFHFFSKLGLKKIYSFIYALGIAVLAYPAAGSPFVDHHATIFSILALYSLSLAILYEKNFYWFLAPMLLIFSFFSKQIPSAYLFVLISIVILVNYFFIKKIKKENLFYFFSGCFFSFLIIFSVFLINEIPLKNFLIQYIYYPATIGSERINNLEFGIKNVLGQFKFIYFSLIPLVFSTYFLTKIKNKNLVQKKEFLISFLFLTSILIFIYCQLLTMNQILIFCLIPISAAISHSYAVKYFNKKYLIYFVLIVFVFSTSKYHIRFNINKKFMELNNVDLSLALDAKIIHKKLAGLKWISSDYKESPTNEINLLVDIKNILQQDSARKIIITDYQFFVTILKNEFPSINSFYDDRSVPGKKNKFYNEYKNFYLSKLKKNKIQ